MTVQAEALAAALGRLQSALGGLGDVCGDDQPGRSFAAGYQPKVESELAAHGTTFTNAFVVNPLCCPSRTSTAGYSRGSIRSS